MGKTFKSLVTEPRVTGGEETRRGKLLGCKRCERRAVGRSSYQRRKSAGEMIMRMRWRPERAVEDDVEHVVTLMGSYETQGEETSFLPSQPERWLDIMIMYVTCAVARAAAGRLCWRYILR